MWNSGILIVFGMRKFWVGLALVFGFQLWNFVLDYSGKILWKRGSCGGLSSDNLMCCGILCMVQYSDFLYWN